VGLDDRLLVARHGKLVLDEYFSGLGSDRPHDVGSAAGAFSELTAGIAIDHSVFKSDAPAGGIDLAGALAAKWCCQHWTWRSSSRPGMTIALTSDGRFGTNSCRSTSSGR
jgi:hypothetical protein